MMLSGESSVLLSILGMSWTASAHQESETTKGFSKLLQLRFVRLRVAKQSAQKGILWGTGVLLLQLMAAVESKTWKELKTKSGFGSEIPSSILSASKTNFLCEREL